LPADSPSPQIATWRRAFPAGDHHWTLGVERFDVAEFFAPSTERDDVLAERARWLADDAARYAQLLPEAVEPLEETIAQLRLKLAGFTPTERLLELGRRCEHDLIWLRPVDDGTWRVVGGVACFPSEWALGEKIGRPLADVHAPVPLLNDDLARRIDAVLNGCDDRAGFRRFNWSLSADVERNHHPNRRLPKLDAATPPENVTVRIEHQLLLRLAPSGAVLFALKIELVGLPQLKTDPESAARLARLLETMSPDVAKYKNLIIARERLITYLRR
jgi:hypothetical protein